MGKRVRVKASKKQSQKSATERLELSRKILAEQVAQGWKVEALFEEPDLGYHASLVVKNDQQKLNLYGDMSDPFWVQFFNEMMGMQKIEDEFTDGNCLLCGGTGVIFE